MYCWSYSYYLYNLKMGRALPARASKEEGKAHYITIYNVILVMLTNIIIIIMSSSSSSRSSSSSSSRGNTAVTFGRGDLRVCPLGGLTGAREWLISNWKGVWKGVPQGSPSPLHSAPAIYLSSYIRLHFSYIPLHSAGTHSTPQGLSPSLQGLSPLQLHGHFSY